MQENSRGKEKKKCHKDLAPQIYVFFTRQKSEIGKEYKSTTSTSEFELWLLFGAVNDLI